MIAASALAAQDASRRRLSMPWRHDRPLVAALIALAVIAALFVAPWPARDASPPALTLAVADLRGHALVISDARDVAHPRRIPLPGAPHELLRLPDGRLVVSLEQQGALALIDPRSGDVQTLAIGGLPHGLALSGDTLYVTDRSTDALRRFSAATWSEREPLATGNWPHAVAALPEGGLAVVNAAADTLAMGERVVAVSDVPETIAVSLNGSVATAGAVGGAIEVFSPDGARLAAYATGGRPVRVLFAPAGDVLAAALSADGAVALIEDGVVRRVAVGGVPDGLAFSPDGRWLYAGDEVYGAVSVLDVRRGVVVQRLAAGASAGAILVIGRR